MAKQSGAASGEKDNGWIVDGGGKGLSARRRTASPSISHEDN
jgi:hypothetical protein